MLIGRKLKKNRSLVKMCSLCARNGTAAVRGPEEGVAGTLLPSPFLAELYLHQSNVLIPHR